MRFSVICRSIALLALAFAPAAGSGQGFQPSRPLELIVHNAPGGGSDILARFIANLIEKEKLLPVRVVVNNKPGGGSATAMAYLAEKRGDSHTLALFTSAWLVTPILAKEARVTVGDMTPIARLVTESALIVVKSDSPYRTLKDFIDAAKREPGKLKQVGGSVQTRGNFVRLQLQKATGAQWSYISYPGGGERISALLGGHMQLLVAEPQELGEHVRSGNMRALAQIAAKRLPGFPDVPTLQESGFDVRADATPRGVAGPPDMPRDAATYWENLFARIAKSAAWRKYLEENLFEDGYMTAGDTVKANNAYLDSLRVMLKAAGLTVYR